MNSVEVFIGVPHPETGEENLTTITYYANIEQFAPNSPCREECELIAEQLQENILVSVLPA